MRRSRQLKPGPGAERELGSFGSFAPSRRIGFVWQFRLPAADWFRSVERVHVPEKSGSFGGKAPALRAALCPIDEPSIKRLDLAQCRAGFRVPRTPRFLLKFGSACAPQINVLFARLHSPGSLFAGPSCKRPSPKSGAPISKVVAISILLSLIVAMKAAGEPRPAHVRKICTNVKLRPERSRRARERQGLTPATGGERGGSW